MSFDTTARQRLATGAEEQEMPACLPLVSFTGDERADMADQEFYAEIAAMWADMRSEGSLVVDAPSRKVGMPWAAPYEGVCFPVEIYGEFVMVSIPADQVERFAIALVEASVEAREIDSSLDIEHSADLAAFQAICKAKGK